MLDPELCLKQPPQPYLQHHQKSLFERVARGSAIDGGGRGHLGCGGAGRGLVRLFGGWCLGVALRLPRGKMGQAGG